ncbi:MAG: hypothetical protein ACLS5Y_03385 [Clostridia bacterium]|jgi:hypothetical protein
MITFIVGLITMIIILAIGVGCLFIVDKIGVEMTILAVMVCIMSYILGILVLGSF